MLSDQWPRNMSNYQTVFERAPFGIALIGFDGRWQRVNDAARSIVGYPPHELEQMAVSDIVFKDDLPLYTEFLTRLHDHSANPDKLELRFKHKQGWLVTVLLGVAPKDGEPLDQGCYMLHMVDITGHKAKEQGELSYRSLIEHHPDLLFTFDMEGYLTYTNKTFGQVFGYALEKADGRPVHFRELTTPDYLPYTEERFRLAASGITQRYESSGIDANGNPVMYEVTNMPIFENGKVVGVHGVSRDISRLKELLRQLQESQEMYRLIADNTQDIISYSSLDGVVLSVTPAVKKVLGHEPKEIIGRSMLELCHPEDAKSIIAEGLSGGFDTKTCTSRVKHKEGHYVWIETTINIVRGVSRRASRLICVSRDISKRKRTEIELLTTKAKLESFIDHNVDPILIFDQDYRLVRINGAYEKTFGWSYGEVIHKHISEMPMTPPERIDEIHQNLEMMSQGKPIIGFETIRMCKDGNVIPVHLTAFPLRNEQGLISGCSMSLRDISERKQAEQFALNSEKLSITGQLAAGIAHEIRNPITAIKGFIQLMNSGEGGKHRYFDIILSEIARIELISSELLLLAKPQAVSVKPQDIVLQLTQVRTLLESQAHLNNVQMILDLNPDEAYVSCDENQLKQVWINFVKNAIEAMPGGGKLVIRLRRKGDRYITVDIKDEGCGIPQDALDKLGQPFYTTKEKGTGLGFMVSKRIVDNHNGTITVQSKQYVGTTVTVCLPFEESNL